MTHASPDTPAAPIITPVRTVDRPAPGQGNRLADSTSPYLLQHAENPVDWRPWGADALEEARQLDKPIFLSVGYATCYWCHVMERQVFENPALAAAMNAAFLCIKVDREQHPGLDDVYMTATQLLTGSGGWPMNLALTPPGARSPQDPGLEPFWAATYVPPEPAHGRPGMAQVIHALSGAWQSQRQDVLTQAEQVTQAMREVADAQASPSNAQEIENEENPLAWVDESTARAVAAAVSMADRRYGGFGGAPKFPQPALVAFLHHAAQESEGEEARALSRAVDHTLAAMARGGMFDQLAGGFHRYSVDDRWLVPHFEKMLYDQGQLLSLYAQALRAAPPSHPDASLWRQTLAATVHYLQREMRDDTGAFFSAQDAEVDGHEGGNYLWTPDEIRAALADTPDLIEPALELFGLSRGPNFTDPHVLGAKPKNVLFLAITPDQWAARLGLADHPAQAQAKLQQAIEGLLRTRTQRKPPITDDKVLAAWNGMAISGLVHAAQACQQPDWLDLAQQAADAVLHHLVQDDGGVFRAMRHGVVDALPAALEDHAHLLRAFATLHLAGRGDGKYLDAAARIATRTQRDFADDQHRYFDTAAAALDAPDALPVRPRSLHDGACPSGSASIAWALHDLYGASADPRWNRALESAVAATAQEAQQASLAYAHGMHAAAALARLNGPPLRLHAQPNSQTGQNKSTGWTLRIDIRPDLYATGLRLELLGDNPRDLTDHLPPAQPVTAETHGHRGTITLAIWDSRGAPGGEGDSGRNSGGGGDSGGVRVTASPCSMAACFEPVSAEVELTNEPTRASAATPPGATLPGGQA